MDSRAMIAVLPGSDLPLIATIAVGLGVALVLGLVAHVAAALRHHFVRRDDVLARMLLRWGKSR